MKNRLAMIAILTVASASSSFAQKPAQNDVNDPRRAMLEQRLRERTGAIVKQRLALSDAQMTRLQQTNKQFEPQRSDLLMRERSVRRELREQLLSGDSANQTRVSQLLDQAMQMERQRLDLQQSEQRELAKFLTPVQRAKLFGLQNELRKRTQQMRNRQLQGQGNGVPRRGLRLR